MIQILFVHFFCIDFALKMLENVRYWIGQMVYIKFKLAESWLYIKQRGLKYILSGFQQKAHAGLTWSAD